MDDTEGADYDFEDTGGLLGIVIGMVIGLPILTALVIYRLFFMN